MSGYLEYITVKKSGLIVNLDQSGNRDVTTRFPIVIAYTLRAKPGRSDGRNVSMIWDN